MVVVGLTKKQFANYLKYEIKPLTYRKFENGRWMFYHTKLGIMAAVAKRFYAHVDWSDLPTHWQMLAAGAVPADDPTAAIPVAKTDSPYATLFLTEDAPIEVVKVVYKALSRMYHPDTGGDSEKMTELNIAYNAITKTNLVS